VRVEWRPLANEDLAAIRRYIARDDKERARSFAAELRGKLRLLADHPQMGRPAGPGLPEGIRMLVLHESYLAYYRIIAAGEEEVVQILRIKHAAQYRP
jgi:plasmid stabilization system protein ParE